MTIWLALYLASHLTYATEQKLSGLVDIRFSTTKGYESYIVGDYGKFRYSDGSNFSLAQLALNYQIDWENNFSFHLITNAYGDGEKNALGVTESYFKYRSLPTENGLRYQLRSGFMYPKVSLENINTGWSSPYTLSYSTMNTWIGEEVRHLGIEGSITRLGRFSGSEHDLTLNLALLSHNDPNGSMLAWHGWTLSSRQSFWNEMLDFPNFPALSPGQPLSLQAKRSDPFREIDSKIGYHISGQWHWRNKLTLLAGSYDNRGGTDNVEDGQYNWITRFSNLGFKWKMQNDLTLLFQAMYGETKMRVINDFDVVDVDFNNAFLLLTKKWQNYRLSGRIEKFEVKDLDGIYGDNNDEIGDAITISFAYQMTRNLFLHLEYNRIDSERPSRLYHELDNSKIESQWQLGGRLYF